MPAATLENFAGRLIRPDDAEYDAARIVWNAMADKRPALIARCAGADDVISALRFAREHELVVAVRGGGHSVAGFGTCDGGIVIDLSGMRGLTIDPERRVAHVEGGAHLSQLDREAQSLGLACPVGVVGHTGVAGLTLGGGYGYLARMHGMVVSRVADRLGRCDAVEASERTAACDGGDRLSRGHYLDRPVAVKGDRQIGAFGAHVSNIQVELFR